MEDKKELSPKQGKAIMVLAVGGSHKQAAQVAEVKANTITQWMKDEDFRAELRAMLERTRQRFESRVMIVANNSLATVQEALDSKDPVLKLKAAALGLAAATRLASRYKEHQLEGYVPPSTPMIVLPVSTKMPWKQKSLPPVDVIDVESKELDDGTNDDDFNDD